MSPRPGISEANRSTGQVRIVDLPAVLPPRRRPAAPATKPAVSPAAAPPPRLVNWRLVAGVGLTAWLLVLGLAAACWALVRPNEPTSAEPVVQALPAAPQTPPPPAPPVPEVKEEAPKPTPDLPSTVKPSADLPETAVKTAVPEGPPERDPRLPPELIEEKAADLPKPFDPEAAPRLKKPLTCGTSITFCDDPDAAFQQGKADRKMVFIIHVAGNFEDSGFT